MTSVAVTLGGVVFRDFEVPDAIAFGGKQRLALHQPVGGGQVIDVLGAEPDAISFTGTFSGPDAELRARTLDVARAAGAVLPLSWGGFAYRVMIASFSAVYRKSWWIPFTVELVPVLDLVMSLPSVLAQAGLDLAQAAGLGAASGVSLASFSLDAVSLAAAQGELETTLATAGAGLVSANKVFVLGAGTADAVSALTAIGSTSLVLAGAAAASAYVGRAAANIGLGGL